MLCCFAAGRAALRGWSTRRRATDARPGGLPAQVREATGGVGGDVVLDAVGGKIGHQAIESAADGHGRVGIYGVASGTWTALDAAQIVQRGRTTIGALGAPFSKSPTEQRADAEHALALAAADQLPPRLPPARSTRFKPQFRRPPSEPQHAARWIDAAIPLAPAPLTPTTSGSDPSSVAGASRPYGSRRPVASESLPRTRARTCFRAAARLIAAAMPHPELP